MQNLWNLIVIEDSSALPGKSICNAINLITGIIEIRFIVISDLQGAGIAKLKKFSEKAVELNTTLNFINEVTQFDWCNFFLFSNRPKNINEILSGDYANSISKTTTTVRAVDDTYIYVYTPYNEIVEIFNKNYCLESVKSGLLQDLDFPE